MVDLAIKMVIFHSKLLVYHCVLKYFHLFLTTKTNWVNDGVGVKVTSLIPAAFPGNTPPCTARLVRLVLQCRRMWPFPSNKIYQSNPPDIKVYLLYNIRGMGLLNYSVILLQWRPWLVDFLAIILNMSNNSWSQFFRACHEMSAPVHPFFARGCIESQCPCPWRRWHNARVLCLSIKVCTAQLNTFDYVWHSIYNYI